MKKLGFFLLLFTPIIAYAQGLVLPSLELGLKEYKNPSDVVNTIKILVILTILTLSPAILILMTSFTRLVIVFSFIRQAIGTQQMPPNQVVIGLSLFLTFFIMSPFLNKINENALKPYLASKISQQEAFDKAILPLREFMFSQTRDKDLELFMNIAKQKKPKNRADVPTSSLVPAFVISELKTAFQIGFIIYLPFLIIDLIASSVLMTMGMMMLPPVLVSLPFKIVLFILVDGWNLLVGSVVKKFWISNNMNQDLILNLAEQTIKTTIMIAAPLLLGALAIGLIVSFIQAITQINESTLTFIPKMIVVVMVLILAGPWMVDIITNFTFNLYDNIGSYIRG